MKVIEAKIKESEKKYQDGITDLKGKLKSDIEAMEAKHEVDKVELEKNLVQEILGKIL